MTTAILHLAAGIIGVIASWLIWDIWLKPLMQKFYDWVANYKNQQAINDASQNNQNQNNQDQADQDTRNKILDGLSPKDPKP